MLIDVFMKMRVEYIKRPYKDKIYSYPFLVTSYRDEKGVARNKVIQSLSHLPEHAVEALRIALRSEGRVDSVPVDTIEYLDSLPFGDIWAVWSVMKQIGMADALEMLPENHQGPIIASIIDRVVNPGSSGKSWGKIRVFKGKPARRSVENGLSMGSSETRSRSRN